MQVAASARHAVALTAQQIVSETFPRGAVQGAGAPTSGDVLVGMVGLLEGDAVSNVYVAVNVLASGLTLAKVGIWDLNGNLLASSADISSSLTATGMKQLALSATFRATRQDGYYVGLVQVGTTPAQLMRGISNTFISSATGGGFRPVGIHAGQTDLPNPATFGNTGGFYWFGVG